MNDRFAEGWGPARCGWLCTHPEHGDAEEDAPFSDGDSGGSCVKHADAMGVFAGSRPAEQAAEILSALIPPALRDLRERCAKEAAAKGATQAVVDAILAVKLEVER